MARIYLSPPDVGPAERKAVMRAFDSNWITTLGPEVDAFEAEVCALTGAPSAAALSSATAALHLALAMSDVGPGDEVWVSTLTFVAPVNAVKYLGASLRFIDSEPETWNMDPELLASELTAAAEQDRLPKAVVAVDLYGQCAQLDRIAEICDSYGVTLIEDAAEAIGASWKDKHAGTYGRFGVYSFNGNKIMTTSGGGMLVGSAEDMARARYLASQARQPVPHYEHDEVGYNYRLSNILAAMGRAQLERLPSIIDRCFQINATYRAELGQLDGIDFMPWDERGKTNGWLTVMTLAPELVTSGVSPLDVCDALAAQEIEARPAWKPMHQQKVFASVPLAGGAVSDDIFDRGVCLPSGSTLTDEDLERVIAALRGALAGPTNTR
ncbi:MAG: aminotransferase class I/II-fold pyridoxal phosphate-dependent enzyme [Microthrixaceae bacterium]|nr:aminotransferase class I/II-fold pyridoxal phosphate-dependent enzyme [Microthrixaceae bacterium]